MQVKEAIKYGLDNLNGIEDKNIKVMLVLSNILNVKKEKLIADDSISLSKEDEKKFKLSIDMLNQNIPVQYIVGKQEFFGAHFKVNENVLIPRFDTEVLIEKIIDYCKKDDKEYKILDLCTGSGIIGITLSKHINKSKVTLSDISKEALEVARENALINKVDVTIVESNMFENILDNDFDIIVSNPPYIETAILEKLDAEVKKEPKLALDGGQDGLFFYKIIATEAKKYLKESGILFLEIGYNQRESVTKLLEDNNFKNIECIKDYNGLDRIIKGE